MSPPYEWVISLICEEFGCLPSQAEHELVNDPSGAVMNIMEMRHFAKAKERVEQHSRKPTGDAPSGPAVEQVHYIRSEIVKEDREAMKNGFAR